MVTKQPVKYDAAQHTVFAPGDTFPPGIAPQVAGPNFSGDGTTGNPLRITATGAAGPEGPAPVTQDGGGLDWTFNPVTNILGASAVVSPDDNNCLELRANGLYFACP